MQCAACGREAQYFCCWNTSYCDLQCQRSHWPTHMARCGQLRPQTAQVAAGVSSGNRMPLTAMRPAAPNAPPAVNSNVPQYNPSTAPGVQHFSISGTFLPNPTLQSHSRPPAPNALSPRNDSPPHLVDLSTPNAARGTYSSHQPGPTFRPQGPPAAHNNGRSDLSSSVLRQPPMLNSQQRNSLPQQASGRLPSASRGGPVARFESQNRYVDGSTALQTPIPHPQTLLPSSSSSNNNSFR